MRLKKHIRQVIREEISEVPKESYLKYKKLLDKLVDDVFTDFVCGYSWETFNLHHREGTQLRIILYTKNMENLNFELYGQKKQELYNLINDFFPKFNGIFITTDTTKCGEELNESEITERCWKGYTQKGMKTMFGKRYPNCVKIKKKKESKEGVGGYAAPAFEMEPDHVHFKHQYNESSMLPHTKRRLHKIHELLESLMYDAHNPCDYNDKDEYFNELVYDLGWMVRNERYGLSDADWIDIYEYIVEHKQDEIKQYYTDSCVGNLRESIKNALDEQVTKKYSKPTEKVDKLVYKWLDDYFEGSQMYKKESWKYYSFHFEFCKNGREIAELNVRFEDKSPDFGPKDKRPTNERSVDEVQLFIYPDMIYELLADIPIRKNYLLYLIEEWFEDTQLDKIQQEFNRNDLSLDYLRQSMKTRGDICVPPIPKPENITIEEMRDLIKKNTLYSYKDMDKHEEEEPGWTEELYLGILNRKESERVNQEYRENNEGTLREEVNPNESFTGDTPTDITKQFINKPVKLIGDVNTTTKIQNINVNRDGSVKISLQNGIKVNSTLLMMNGINLEVDIPLKFKIKKKGSINESETKTYSSLLRLLNMLFEGFDDIYYDWANYMCGMGECCDPYAIGFVLPKNDYDDYIFKLVDSVKYDDDGDYPKELRDELPEVCYESPDLKNPNFDTIVFYGSFAEEIEDYMGHPHNWNLDLLKIINNQFGCEAKRIVII